jgi:hypothetical protein
MPHPIHNGLGLDSSLITGCCLNFHGKYIQVTTLRLSSQLLQLDQDGTWDPFVFREGMHILLSFSLIKKSAISGIYSLHPLVHCWSCGMTGQEQQTSFMFALDLLSSSIIFHFTSDDYKFCRTLIPHIKSTG